MKKFTQPLNDDELEDLEDLLLDRFDEDEDGADDGRDEGLLLLDELDGFLTALVSGPVALMPSVWLPAVWGDFPPEWESEEEANYYLGLLRRYHNEIAKQLVQHPAAFEPLYSWYEMERERVEVVDDWCEGYLLGVRMLGDRWEVGHPQVTELLAPMRAFSEETQWQGHSLSPAESDVLRATIVQNVRSLHSYWQQQRGIHVR